MLRTPREMDCISAATQNEKTIKTTTVPNCLFKPSQEDSGF